MEAAFRFLLPALTCRTVENVRSPVIWPLDILRHLSPIFLSSLPTRSPSSDINIESDVWSSVNGTHYGALPARRHNRKRSLFCVLSKNRSDRIFHRLRKKAIISYVFLHFSRETDLKMYVFSYICRLTMIGSQHRDITSSKNSINTCSCSVYPMLVTCQWQQ